MPSRTGNRPNRDLKQAYADQGNVRRLALSGSLFFIPALFRTLTDPCSISVFPS